jgi:hypothetical protein
MMTRGGDGLFLQQLQWAPAQIAPPQMLAVQLIATQLALKTAIADVEEAVRRVEGKVPARQSDSGVLQCFTEFVVAADPIGGRFEHKPDR